MIYKFTRKLFVKFNDFFGMIIGFKLKRVSYSRPATIKAKELFKDKPVRVIEIGCAAGNNTLDVLNQLNIEEYLIIDPYEKASGASYDDYDHKRLILMREQSKARLEKYGAKVKWIYDFSDKAIKEIEGKFDYIYIDGDHSYNYALSDMRNYSKLLAEKFIFAGHDIDQQSVARAFIEFVNESHFKDYEVTDPDWIIFKD
jgi:hypothetical protein